MAKQTKKPNPDETKEEQSPQGNQDAGLEKQESNDELDGLEKQEEQDKANVKRFKAKRPLLHNGKTYTVGDDVTALFEDEALEHLLKMGAIVEA